MKCLLDSSVLIAAIIQVHPHHPMAFPWLNGAKKGEFEAYVSSHSLAEVYAVLTRLPLKPKIGPALAHRLIRENTQKPLKVIDLSVKDYRDSLNSGAELGIEGGQIYDGILAQAAKKAGVDKIVTFNIKDFQKVWPEGHEQLFHPI